MESVQVQAASAAQATNEGKLLRVLGRGFGVAVVVGGTIGVGILRTPGDVAAQLGSFWPIMTVWLMGGLYTLLASLSMIELGTALPQAGGPYAYARRAFGELVGFLVGWSDWLVYSSVLAFIAIAASEFSAELMPLVKGQVKGIALLILGTFSLFHWMGLRLSSRVQQLACLAKSVAFLALVATCFIVGKQDSVNDLNQITPPLLPVSTSGFIAVMIALQLVISTYEGWQGAVYFTEEDRDPSRNLPWSIIGGILLITSIYLLINAALFYALPISQLAGSKLPAADAAHIIFGAQGRQIITTLSLISLLSIINVLLMGATRIFYAMSRDHLLIAKAATVNKAGTPAIAMLLSTLLAAALILCGTFERAIAVAAFLTVCVHTSCFFSLLVLRRREPGLSRPFKAWGHPWTTLVATVGSVLFLIGVSASDTVNSLLAIMLIAISYPAYWIIKGYSNRWCK